MMSMRDSAHDEHDGVDGVDEHDGWPMLCDGWAMMGMMDGP